MNVNLLRKVQRAILKHPDQFEMSWWFHSTLSMRDKLINAGGCGTAGCIGGWAIHIHRQCKTLAEAKEHCYNPLSCPAKLLGLKVFSAEADRLFIDEMWPQPFRRRYQNGKTPLTRAKAAAARIDHFIKTKGAE